MMDVLIWGVLIVGVLAIGYYWWFKDKL